MPYNKKGTLGNLKINASIRVADGEFGKGKINRTNIAKSMIVIVDNAKEGSENTSSELINAYNHDHH